ncbi:hypothetical protein MRB53_037741 [Persea americana]|nr:hypothetical protein MRB53_037741 [Persea americana]
MPQSADEYGLEDDDTAFLEAATQIEGDFEPSSRPAKRRRIAQLDGVDSNDIREPEEDPDYYFPGELDRDGGAQKSSRFKIHVPERGRHFQDMILTQTQHNLDENPAALRGAIWKRPPLVAKPHSQNSACRPFTKPPAPSNGIGSYFTAMSKQGNTFTSDAELAASLQDVENRGTLRRPANVHQGSFAQAPLPRSIGDELADLPPDAFSSSSPEKSQEKVCITISSQPTASQHAPVALRGPQHGLKQMTIFGKPATQSVTASQAATKRHAWPLKSKEEPPTHHKLDDKAMETWIFPTNLGTIRDYQFNIVSRSLFHNTLVALPTGLGKTFIAATVMLNYYRWTRDSQIVFMAPTKPLIAQQMEACYQIVGIPRKDTVLMTGETTPGLRAEEWIDRRVFFMTPQTVINDLKTGICDPKKIVLIVVDEAHKATGGYAYTEVVAFMRRFNSSFRVLALTATPGSTTEAVQAVIDNLGIARVELRTEQSLDIVQYTHEKHTDTEVLDFSDEQCRIMDMFAKALRPVLEKLCSQNAYWSKDPMQLTAFGLTQARKKWMASEAGRKAPMPIKGMVNSQFTILSSLAHNITLLKFHGINPFYNGVINFQKEVEGGKTKAKAALSIAQSTDFVNMMSILRTWTNNPDFLGHPKLEHLRRVILNHFMDAGEGRHGSDVSPNKTRVMVFAHYRDSAEDICRVLKRSEPMIRPHVFVGQAASKGSEGMDQRRQNAVIQDFKAGKYNTLVATSIGEEGLDIGDVDLIVCYDASASPIRMLQRIGRTGRKRIGRVSLLLMKGKEENDYAKAQDNYLYIQKTIADTTKYAYRDDESRGSYPRLHSQWSRNALLRSPLRTHSLSI